MADQHNATEMQDTKPKSPIKLVVIVVGLMVVEAVGIATLLMMTGAPSANAEIEGQHAADGEAMTEIELVNTRFQNMATGRVWDWQAEIHLKVRQRNRERVEQIHEQRRAEILEGVATIFRRAQFSHLKEPGLQTISRQITAYVQDVFGNDPADGSPYVERIVIPKCDGYPADF